MPALPPGLSQARISLAPYINQSPYCIPETFSAASAYTLFQTLGLRHLLVTRGADVAGIITRKDLLGCPLQATGHGTGSSSDTESDGDRQSGGSQEGLI